MTDDLTTRTGDADDADDTPLGHPTESGSVRTPPQSVGDETKVPLADRLWQREGTDAPDAADIEDPERQL